MKNVLEKILEEIDNRKSYHEEKVYQQDDYEIQKMYCNEELDWITNIIRFHMNDIENDGWIPCSERLPEEHDSMFAKVSDEVNVTTIDLEEGTRKTETDYTLDGKWHIEINNRVVKKKVIAWQPLPNPYKGVNNNG